MERYIGLDVHAASCTAAVMDGHGKRLGAHVIETNGEALVKFLATQPGTVRVCMEEGTQSEWLYQVLSPHSKQVVVIGFSARSGPHGQKNDELDAYDLADRHRRDALPRAVFKDTGKLTELRQLVKVHASIVRDSVRVQNRLKAMFRSRGVRRSCNSIGHPSSMRTTSGCWRAARSRTLRRSRSQGRSQRPRWRCGRQRRRTTRRRERRRQPHSLSPRTASLVRRVSRRDITELVQHRGDR